MNREKIPNRLEWSHSNLNIRSINNIGIFFFTSNLKKLEYRRFAVASFAIYRHEIYRHVPNKHSPPLRIGESKASRRSLVLIPWYRANTNPCGIANPYRIGNPIYFTDNRDRKIRIQRYYRILPDIYCRCGEPWLSICEKIVLLFVLYVVLYG